MLDRDDNIALLIANKQGMAGIVCVLIAAGVELNIICGGEMPATALLVATAMDNVEIAEALIAAGADVNIPTNGENPTTPLFMAIGNGLVDLSLTLIEKGANLSVTAETPEGEYNVPIDDAFEYNFPINDTFVLLDKLPDMSCVCAQMFCSGSSV